MRITVIGAGNSGLAMSAHLSYHGHQVSLWNRSKGTIEKLLDTHVINTHGIVDIPIGIDFVTTNLHAALKDSEMILITTPASSHQYLAELLAKSMTESIPIVLNPGRTFGALAFHETFVHHNRTLDPLIAETQTIIYTCRKEEQDSVTIYSLKEEVEIAALKKSLTGMFINSLPSCIRGHYKPAPNFLYTSLGNVGMVLHCIPFMLNTGWTECATAEYKYYYDGITPTIGRFIQHIDDERIAVGKSLGVTLESTIDWMKREYSTTGSTICECIKNNKAYDSIDAPKSMRHRYIYEDVPHGLVPVEIIGREMDVPTPYISLAIDLASALFEENFRASKESINCKKIRAFLEE